ncbi:acetyl esterase/lipase [Nocardia tenerifensis]|uniref:Acetyl esterase/lipase n=1 Tax=Nocardia tenerifensis TaxID=228006 RepID=A0A318KFG8_9NOCA|nr:alpha/beta hydrolase fold domain-containing protein [Nocardia tenerifensis]PXX70973.1 acetyl esterase/lipase [Nocardia tenerifensis]
MDGGSEYVVPLPISPPATQPSHPNIARPRPPFDPELAVMLPVLHQEIPATVRLADIPVLRERLRAMAPSAAQLLAGRPIGHVEHVIAGFGGAEIVVSVFARTDHAVPGPGFFHTHGGGMMLGDRFFGLSEVLDWVQWHDAVCVSVEYRLAPEFPDPVPVEDCYAGLVWTAANADALGIDPGRLIVAGASAGGGLAAGLALLARDRGAPGLAGQILMCPMLDDRGRTVSSHQFVDGLGLWDRGSHSTAWGALLAERFGTDDVSFYAAPARAENLDGLPPAYIDVGSAELLRDEAVAYASGIWACGGVAELHVWQGGFHGFCAYVPRAAVSVQARRTRDAWVARLVGVQR